MKVCVERASLEVTALGVFLFCACTAPVCWKGAVAMSEKAGQGGFDGLMEVWNEPEVIILSEASLSVVSSCPKISMADGASHGLGKGAHTVLHSGADPN